MKTKIASNATLTNTCSAVAALASPVPDSVLESRFWWLWPHLLSLDAPLVAVGWQMWWAQTAQVDLRWHHHLILGLAVWLVYLADRLADALHAEPHALVTARHAFAWRHSVKTGVLLVAVAGSLAALTLGFLPPRQFAGGLGLLFTVSVYFHFTHRRQGGWLLHLPKEALVGILFAAGTSFFVGCTALRLNGQFLAEGCAFGLLCFLNCAFITRWEGSPQDWRNPFSILNAYPRLTACLPSLCLALSLLSAGLSVFLRRELALRWMPLLIGALGLWMLNLHRRNLSKPLLRVLADAVLLGPWICLWFV